MGTRLTRITRELSNRDPDAAIAAAARRVADWSGGTRLGEGLRHVQRPSGGSAAWPAGRIVVIVSDGWDRGDPDLLGAADGAPRPGRAPNRLGEPAEGVARVRAPGAGDGGGAARTSTTSSRVTRWRRSRSSPRVARVQDWSRVKEVLDDIERWRRAGRRVAIARVVGVEGSGPRDAGRHDGGERRRRGRGLGVGRLRGGRGGRRGAQVLAGRSRARIVSFGYSDDEAFAVGLTCGGTIHLYVEPLDW